MKNMNIPNPVRPFSGYSRIGGGTTQLPAGRGNTITDNLLNMDSVPVYDDGGLVLDDSDIVAPPSTAATNAAAAKAASGGIGNTIGDVKKAAALKPKLATGGAPAINAALGTTPQASISTMPDQIMDRGGDVNIHDGQHVPAILQTGERVLSRKDNEMYKQGYRPIHIYDESQDVAALIPPTAEAQPEPEQPKGTPEQRNAVNTDVKKALGSGDLVALGKARIAEKHLPDEPPKMEEQPLAQRTAPQGPVVPNYTQRPTAGPKQIMVAEGPQGVKQPSSVGYAPIASVSAPEVTPSAEGAPAQPQLIPTAATMPTYGGPGKPVAQGALIPAKQVPVDTYKGQQQDIDTRIRAAMASGNMDEADRLQYEKDRLQQISPYGSAYNHPGKLGRFEHIMSGIGQGVAGIVAPGILSQIPGTRENMAARNAGGFQRISQDVENESKLAAANAKETKVVPPQDQLIAANQELRAAQASGDQARIKAAQGNVDDITASFNAKEPTKAEPAKDQPATDADRADYTQRINNSGLTGPALQVYGTAPVGATKAELDKRFDEAIKLRGMNQKDAETKIADQARKDNAAATQVQRGTENIRKDKDDRETARKYIESGYRTSLQKQEDGLSRIDAAVDNLNTDTPVGQALAVPKTLTALVSGQGTGVRITQAELNMISTARTGSTYTQFLQKLAEGKTLTQKQVDDLKFILQTARARAALKEQELSRGLDEMNYATSIETLRAEDTKLRHNLTSIEKVPPTAHGLLRDNNSGEIIGYVNSKDEHVDLTGKKLKE